MPRPAGANLSKASSSRPSELYTAGKTRAGWERLRSLGARAALRALPQGAGARRGSEPARAPGEGEWARVAGRRPPGEQEPRGGGAAAGLQCHLSGESPRAHTLARAHVHTVGSENTSESP